MFSPDLKIKFLVAMSYCHFLILEEIKIMTVELEEILAELFPSDDPLDQKDFDVTQYINGLFPNEQSYRVFKVFRKYR